MKKNSAEYHVGNERRAVLRLVTSTLTRIEGSGLLMAFAPLPGSKLDSQAKPSYDRSMNIPGRVQDGVVVVDGDVSLPEGAIVSVSFGTSPLIRVAEKQKRVELPLVRSSKPGSVHLTNEMIAELMDEEDASF